MWVERYLRELESPKRASRRNWRFAAGLAGAFLLLVGIAGYGMLQERRAAAERAFVRHSLAVQEAVLELDLSSARMEVHHRGFLIKGDEDARALRERAFADGARASKELLRLVATDPLQSASARRAIAAFEARHARMLDTARIADAQGLDAGRAAMPLRGEGSADAVVASLAGMRARQAMLLSASTARADRQAAHFRALLSYGTALALAVVLAVSALMLRQLSRNVRLGAQLLQMHHREEDRARELERSNRELEAFSYTISHDLRAPLRHIDGYVRMLTEDAGEQLEGDARRYLDTISDSARRMGALIDDLLAYSRLGRKPVECTTLDMNALTDRVLEEAGAGRSPATVTVEALPPAWADPVLLRQAWVNLLSNALKYSAPKGSAARIEVSGERDGRTIRYRVRDNGVGFDMRYADKLFGVFQRMHAQDEFEGTGVGLAIVHQVVQRHGGRVSAQASPGEGACFTIELPAGAA
ncbi:MAG TPA: ATP-binding protein [Xanthomonadaceae bacterium]|nr:ATP-binding protein [Xanthomonadaceae bacterium]